MNRIFFLLILLLATVALHAQTRQAKKYYKQGTHELSRKNFEKAIDYFNLSLEEGEYANTLINRAAAYFFLGDSCNYCKDLVRASRLGDIEAGFLYERDCKKSYFTKIISDSIKTIHPDAVRLEIVKYIGSTDSTIIVHTIESKQFEQDSISEEQNFDINEEREEEILTFAEVMPEFPGGTSALYSFIARSIQYPKAAREKRIQGTVYVSFTVNQEGYVSASKVLRGVHQLLDNEALRIIDSMPRWKPGMQSGKAVSVRYSLPIKFAISEQKENE